MSDWFAVYRTSDGELLGLGTVLPETLPAGSASKNFGATRPEGIWNTSTLVFDAEPAPRVIRKDVWLERWPPAKLGIFLGRQPGDFPAGADVERILAFRTLVVALDKVDLDSTLVGAGLQELVDVGLLTAGERDAIDA